MTVPRAAFPAGGVRGVTDSVRKQAGHNDIAPIQSCGQVLGRNDRGSRTIWFSMCSEKS